MSKPLLLVATVASLSILAGCATHTQNPLDRYTYRGEPLVKQVETGMTRDRVLALGGEPSSTVDRRARPGTCNNYVLYREGKEQPYYVSFDGAGRVDGKGFLTCRQLEENQRN
ncbi:osmotically-inducible lipoprotein OsmE [Stutzerimonas tarimensis]|uniref:Osmotically-inducible lipoprotein OsmE n=1 Tax=Stutzerimonas tarimensis TaxID=1507735 RepID=A0ABV7T479_9GAMM